MIPKVEEIPAPRAQPLGSQTFKSAGRFGPLRDDPRPVQPRGRPRDGPPRGSGMPAESGLDKRAQPLSRVGGRRESPSSPAFQICGVALGRIGLVILAAAEMIRRKNRFLIVWGVHGSRLDRGPP